MTIWETIQKAIQPKTVETAPQKMSADSVWGVLRGLVDTILPILPLILVGFLAAEVLQAGGRIFQFRGKVGVGK